MESKRLATAKKFISQFAALNAEALGSILADNYIHEFAPATGGHQGPNTRAELIMNTGNMGKILSSFPFKVEEYIESESRNEVTVYAKGGPVFRADVMDDGIPKEEWAYQGEFIFLIFMDESGEKLVRCLEFRDSKATDEKLRPLVRRAHGNRQRLAAAGSA